MDSKHNVEVLQQPLDRVAPEVESVLLQLQPIAARLSALFTSLAVAPEGYIAARAEIERLLTARAPLIQRLGELAAHVLVLRETRADEGVNKPADATADDAPDALSTPELESKPPSAPSPPPSPVSQRQLEEFVLAKSTNGSPRAPTAAEDKTILLSLANHVVIAAETPTNLAEEISALERASDEAVHQEAVAVAGCLSAQGSSSLQRIASAMERLTRQRDVYREETQLA